MNTNKRKRTGKKRVKKLLKRTKVPNGLFDEVNFDSSSDENTVNDDSVRKSIPSSEFVICNWNTHHLTPSKSETEIPIPVNSFLQNDCNGVIEDTEKQSKACLLDRFADDDSDDSDCLSFDHVVDVFRSNGSGHAEIVSVDMTDDKRKEKKSMKGVRKEKPKNEDFSITEVSNESDTSIQSEDSFTSPEEKKVMGKVKEIEITDTKRFDHKVHSYIRKDGIIVALEENTTHHFYGMCLLSVLHGEIEILGYKLNKESPETKIYSPRGTSLLYLKNITKSKTPVAHYLQATKFPNKFIPTEICAIVLCKKLEDPKISLIEKHISQQILPRPENSKLPRIVFQPSGNWNLLQINEKWDELIMKITETTKMLICGGKGVGKTTFLRFAINRLLMKFEEVRVVDLDPGQSEFTTPGCISVVKVGRPVFGPNYTHLQESQISILSDINIAFDPERYINSVQLLSEYISDGIPTLINFMGYTHGIGFNILSSVIEYVLPTDIVQIASQDVKKNYKFLLDPQVVEENSKLFCSVQNKLDYTIHEIGSMCDVNESWTAESRQLREMCVLSYISESIDCNSIFKTKSLYKIALDDIVISDLKGDKIHPAAINASLVALCSVEYEELMIFRCYGWGIVKGIDVLAGHLILMTSNTFTTLDKATHLVATGVGLPPSIYMTPDQVVGPMPYVIDGVLMSFGQIPKRSRLSINKQ